MRITEGMVASSTLRNIELNQERTEQLQNQLTSGSRIVQPSDDPIGTARALSFQDSLAQSDQYLKNIDQGTAWLNASDAALGSLTDVLNRARELTVQASNDTMTNSDRAAVQAEVEQLQQQVLGISNTQYGAYYIFAGTKSNAQAFTDVPPGSFNFVYQGNSGSVSRQISP